MKKIILFLFVLLLVTIKSQAQQRPHYSQYMMNQFILNPAVAGTSDHYDFRAGYRNQWAGFKDFRGNSVAPKTFYASAHGHLGQHIGPYRGKHINEPTKHHGIGAIILNDQTDITSRTSIYGSYAYNMKMAKDFRLSIGTFLGVQQFRLDGNKVYVQDQTSPYLAGMKKTVMDGSIGFWGYGKNYFVGGSLQQIFQNKFFASDIGNGVNRLNHHYFFTAGYQFKMNNDFSIVPSFLIKAVSPAPVSFDINAKVKYKNLAWLGASYRRQDAVVFLAGVNIINMFEIGYSYDYSISDISTYTSGSHEIMLAYKLSPRGKVTSPSDFW